MNSETVETFKTAVAEIAFKSGENGAAIYGSDHRRMPWMFDFRELLLQPKWMNVYAEIFWERFGNSLPFQVCAMETAGIALVAAIVMKGVERGTPVNGLYIRKSRNKKGMMKIVEGAPTNDPIILVDDLINSGRTFLKQIKVLEEHGLHVSQIFAIVRFHPLETYTFASERNINITTLFQLEEFGYSNSAPKPVEGSFDTVWKFSAPNPSLHWVIAKSTPVLDENALYFGTDNGTFLALEQKSGKVLWELSLPYHPEGKGIFSAPALLNGVVYFGAYDGTVYALDTKTGKKLWAYDDADWIGSSPTINAKDGIVYIGLEFGLLRRRGGIIALDARSGYRIWEHRFSEYTHGSPLFIQGENLVVIGSNDGIIYAYEAKSGAPRWKFATRGDIKGFPAYDGVRNCIIAGSMDGSIYFLNALTGTPIHTIAMQAGTYSSPLVVIDTVFVASLDKYLYAIDLNTHEVRWKFLTNGRIFASPTFFDGSVWIGSNDGVLYELDPSTGDQRSTFQVTERIVNRLVCNEKTKSLFVTTIANEIYCIKKEPLDEPAAR
jgi:outer membrane protein assembly factor BamB